MGSLTTRPAARRPFHAKTGKPAPGAAASARALDALRRIVQALRETGVEAQRQVGVSGAQLFVLQQLGARPLTINELAERTCTHQSSVSAVAQRLEEAGLALRREVESDRRKIALHLTARGRALARRSPVVAQSALVEALARLPASTRTELARGLERLAEEMGLAARAPMFFEEKKHGETLVASARRGVGRSRG